MSEAERPDRLGGRRDHDRRHPLARRSRDTPLLASDPQPHREADPGPSRRMTRSAPRASARSSASPSSRRTRASRAAPDERRQDAVRERLGEVLDPRSNALAKEDSAWEHGYLDLLGDDAPESTGVTQDLMLTRARPGRLRALVAPHSGLGGEGTDRPRHGRGGQDRPPLPGPQPRRPRAGRRMRAGQLLPRIRSRGRATTASSSASTRRRRCSPAAPRTRARPGVENLALIRGDATALPFDDSSFDCVCCFAALHLFADPFDAIDEMRRVLAPGGTHRDHDLDPPAGHSPADEAGRRAAQRHARLRARRDHRSARRARLRGRPPPGLRPGPVRRRPPGGLNVRSLESECRQGPSPVISRRRNPRDPAPRPACSRRRTGHHPPRAPAGSRLDLIDGGVGVSRSSASNSSAPSSGGSRLLEVIVAGPG